MFKALFVSPPFLGECRPPSSNWSGPIREIGAKRLIVTHISPDMILRASDLFGGERLDIEIV